MTYRQDLTGKRFGSLTVISFKEYSKTQKDAIWNCVCDCDLNTILPIKRGNLIDGKNTRCLKCYRESRRGKSIPRRLDLVDQKFGKLTVIRRHKESEGKTSNKNTHWLCECDCGNRVVVPGCALKGNIQKQCGECADKQLALKMSGPLSIFWKGGISGEPKYCHKFNERLKRKIRAQYDHRCYVCDKTEKELNRKLAVHHVDYNKVQGCKGMRWALIPLCPSCHAKTNHNRHFWFNLLYPRLIQDCVDNWGELKVS